MIVYKYQLQVTDKQTVIMPSDRKILSVQVQGGIPCLWAMVDPDSEDETVGIITIGTGHPAPDGVDEFIDTYQLNDGALVFHVFGCVK